MRVVFLEDVPGVAQGGDVKEVKNGFARNYLIPQSLAAPADHNALQGVQRLKRQSEEVRAKALADFRELAQALDGVQVNIEMRSRSGGLLYGSVTGAMIATELSNLIGSEIDRRIIEIPEPIRELGTFDLDLGLHPEVEAQIKVLVYPTGTDPMAQEESAEEEEAEAETGLAEDPPRDELGEDETDDLEDLAGDTDDDEEQPQ